MAPTRCWKRNAIIAVAALFVVAVMAGCADAGDRDAEFRTPGQPGSSADASQSDAPDGFRTPTPAGTPEPTATPTLEPTPRLVKLPSIDVAIAGVKVRRYSIAGDTVEQLLDEMSDHGPTDADDPEADILAQSRVSYVNHWTESGSGSGCRVTRAWVTSTFTVTLPKWTSPSRVPADVASWWTGALRYLRWHEAQHVSTWKRWFAVFDDRVVGQRCSKVPSLLAAWKAGIEAAQSAVDTSAENDRRDDALDPDSVGGG